MLANPKACTSQHSHGFALFMLNLQSLDQGNDLGLWSIDLAMERFCHPNDNIDNAGETITAFSTLLHCMVDLNRHDQAVGILHQKVPNCLLNFLLGNDITTANNHKKTRSKFLSGDFEQIGQKKSRLEKLFSNKIRAQPNLKFRMGP